MHSAKAKYKNTRREITRARASEREITYAESEEHVCVWKKQKEKGKKCAAEMEVPSAIKCAVREEDTEEKKKFVRVESSLAQEVVLIQL